jgi:hypothetical protein
VFPEALEVERASGLAELAQRLRLDLTNTFARDGEQLAEFQLEFRDFGALASPRVDLSCDPSFPSGQPADEVRVTSLASFLSSPDLCLRSAALRPRVESVFWPMPKCIRRLPGAKKRHAD